eukprot:205980_1
MPTAPKSAFNYPKTLNINTMNNGYGSHGTPDDGDDDEDDTKSLLMEDNRRKTLGIASLRQKLYSNNNVQVNEYKRKITKLQSIMDEFKANEKQKNIQIAMLQHSKLQSILKAKKAEKIEKEKETEKG